MEFSSLVYTEADPWAGSDKTWLLAGSTVVQDVSGGKEEPAVGAVSFSEAMAAFNPAPDKAESSGSRRTGVADFVRRSGSAPHADGAEPEEKPAKLRFTDYLLRQNESRAAQDTEVDDEELANTDNLLEEEDFEVGEDFVDLGFGTFATELV
jgi:hypothetical protein